MQGKLLVLISLVVVGLLVVFMPSLFYFQATPGERAGEMGLVSQDELKRVSLEREKATLMEQLSQSTHRIKELNARMPWVGQPDPHLVSELQNENIKAESIRGDLQAVHSTREALVTAQRAVSPMWSSLAFEEAREVWWQRQSEHAGVSVAVWKWDMIFDGLFGGYSRDDELSTIIVSAVLKLLYRLTIGAVLALVDFAVRIPFYLKEYDIFDFDPSVQQHTGAEQGSDAPSIGTAQRVRVRDHRADLDSDGSHAATSYEGNEDEDYFDLSTLEAELGKVERPPGANGWLSLRTLNLVLVWLVIVSGAIVATVFTISVVWSPVCLLCFCAARNNRNMRHGQGRPHVD